MLLLETGEYLFPCLFHFQSHPNSSDPGPFFHLQGSSLPTTVSLVTSFPDSDPPVSPSQAPCDYIGPTQIDQDNLPISRYLAKSHLPSPFCQADTPVSARRLCSPSSGQYSAYSNYHLFFLWIPFTPSLPSNIPAVRRAFPRSSLPPPRAAAGWWPQKLWCSVARARLLREKSWFEF